MTKKFQINQALQDFKAMLFKSTAFSIVFFISACFEAFPYVSFAKTWKLSSTQLEISFNDLNGNLTVLDKRCRKAWVQQLLQKEFSLLTVSQNANVLSLSIKNKSVFAATIELLDNGTLVYRLNGDAALETDKLEFPAAFATPDKNYYLLQTDGDGLLLPVTDSEYPLGTNNIYFCGGGAAMAWMGMVDTAFKTGYMAIIETPYDAVIKTTRATGLITFSPVWLPSMGKFGYERKVTYHFFDHGGYVAQCKKYREYIWNKNKVITLRENEKKTPALAKMIGAVHIYVWDNAREIGFAKELKRAGVNKAFLLWDPNHVPYPEKGYDDSLKELGFASGVYDLYTDLHFQDTATYTVDPNGPLRFSRTTYPGMFNQLAARNKDGKTYFNSYGHTICPATIQPYMTKRIDAELKEFPHEAYFLDVYQANGLFECYAPEHRLTRQQFAEKVVANYRFISEKYHQFMGGEWGADYVGSNSVFVHGMMTLQRTWFNSDIKKKGTIYWAGDWKNNARPSAMLGSRVAPNEYLKYSINEYTRVPLYELVYHDAVVTSWRWEDANQHTPEIWWKKDLFNILYGTVPLWNLDRENWESYKNTFVDSYNKVCPWLQSIGYDELLSHRFLTADHTVQESVFSSGKKVVVNFGTAVYVAGGKTIQPKGWVTMDVK